MKLFPARIAAAALVPVAVAICLGQSAGGLNPSQAFFQDAPQGRILTAILTARKEVVIPGTDAALATDFELRVFSDGKTNQVQMIARGPRCRVDVKHRAASDAGPIQLFTPTTNIYVQGMGFLFSETNGTLAISNQVETHVTRATLGNSFLAPSPGASPADSSGDLRIFSESACFYYRSREADYFGNVRAVNPQEELTAPLLFIHFTTNGQVESMLGSNGVAIQFTDRGLATGDSATYGVTNGDQILRLIGHAVWTNGEERASADEFDYEPARHFWTGLGQVHVRWPASTNSTPSWLEMFAARSTLQMSADGRQVSRMTADDHVVILNPADASRSDSAHAGYEGAADMLVLTGDPVWTNSQMQIRGQTLSLELTNRITHAGGGSHLTVQLDSPGATPGPRTLVIDSDEMVHQTNLATFSGHVHSRLLQGGDLRDTLDSRQLQAQLAADNKPVTIVARGEVQGETAPDSAGTRRLITCADLTAIRSPVTSLWQSVVAGGGVVIVLTNTAPGAEYDRMTADAMNASFAPASNAVERAVGEGNAVFFRIKDSQIVQATGQRGVYTATPHAQVEFTGQPWARSDKNNIENADSILWDLPRNSFRATGRYVIPLSGQSTNAANPGQPGPK